MSARLRMVVHRRAKSDAKSFEQKQEAKAGKVTYGGRNVGGGQDHNVRPRLEAVDLGEQRVDHLTKNMEGLSTI